MRQRCQIHGQYNASKKTCIRMLPSAHLDAVCTVRIVAHACVMAAEQSYSALHSPTKKRRGI